MHILALSFILIFAMDHHHHQPPPSYNEICQTDDSLRQLPRYSDVTLKASFPGFPNTIKIDGNSRRWRCNEVYISDTNGHLLVEAYVQKLDGHDSVVFLNPITREHFLEVYSKQTGEIWNRMFIVFHNNMPLGSGKIKNPLTMELHNCYENQLHYSIRSSKVGVIVVSRTPHSLPICYMNLLAWDGSGSKNFYVWDGVIKFPGQCQGQGITRVEQCLFVSLALVYMINLRLESRNAVAAIAAIAPPVNSNANPSSASGQGQVQIVINFSEPRSSSSVVEADGGLCLRLMFISMCTLILGIWICIGAFGR